MAGRPCSRCVRAHPPRVCGAGASTLTIATTRKHNAQAATYDLSVCVTGSLSGLSSAAVTGIALQPPGVAAIVQAGGVLTVVSNLQALLHEACAQQQECSDSGSGDGPSPVPPQQQGLAAPDPAQQQQQQQRGTGVRRRTVGTLTLQHSGATASPASPLPPPSSSWWVGQPTSCCHAHPGSAGRGRGAAACTGGALARATLRELPSGAAAARCGWWQWDAKMRLTDVAWSPTQPGVLALAGSSPQQVHVLQLGEQVRAMHAYASVLQQSAAAAQEVLLGAVAREDGRAMWLAVWRRRACGA